MYLIIRKTYVRTAKYIYHNKKNRKTAKSLKKMLSRVSMQLPVEVTSHWEMVKRGCLLSVLRPFSLYVVSVKGHSAQYSGG